MDWGWWPAAGAGPWEWAWRAYPGVWLFVLALAGAYVATLRGLGPGRAPRGEPLATRRQLGFCALGLGVLWLALDWPLGALAAGYLLTFHALQYLLVSLVAPPLLLLALPPWLADAPRTQPRGDSRGLTRRLALLAVRPPLGLIAFAAALLLTHLPPVLDAMRASPAGSLAIAIAWLGAGLLLWWPIVGPAPAHYRLPYFGGLVYLVVPFVLPKVPGLIFAFSTTPAYEVYEAAPRVWNLSPQVDQQFAGLVLWIAGSLMVIAALGVLFFRWYAEDQRMARPGTLAVPADPRALDLLFAVPGAWDALQQLVTIIDGTLPEQQAGAELAFAIRAPAGDSPQVVLELHVVAASGIEAALAEHIEGQYAAFLGRLDGGQRDAIVARLAFRVVGYGSRVT